MTKRISCDLGDFLGIKWMFVHRHRYNAAQDEIKRLRAESETRQRSFDDIVVRESQTLYRLREQHQKDLAEATKNAREFVAKHATLERSREPTGNYCFTVRVSREILLDNSTLEQDYLARILGQQVEQEVSRSRFFDVPNRLPANQSWRPQPPSCF